MNDRDSENSAESGQSTRRRVAVRLATVGVAGAMIAAIGGGVAVLHLRAAANVPQIERTPMPVRTVIANRQASYIVRERFAGRLEPARTVQLAFERSGLVTDVLYDEGERVAAGAVIARLDSAPLSARRDQLRAQQRQIAANLELAQLTAKRQQRLSGKGHSSVQRYDETRLAVVALEGELAEIGATIRALDIDIGKLEVHAPFAGIVAARMIDDGAVVEPGTPILELLETTRPIARVGVSPETAAALADAGDYRLLADEQVLPARMKALRRDLSTGTRTVTALFEVDAKTAAPFGEIVELEVERRIAADGFWLPMGALTEGRKGLWTVFTVTGADSAMQVEREAVEVIHQDSGRVFVRGSLADGARVIADGLHRVIPGQAVAIAKTGS